MADKVCDGQRSASVAASFTGLLDGDEVVMSALSGQFDDKQAGAAKTVTLSATLGGAAAADYALPASASTLAAIPNSC